MYDLQEARETVSDYIEKYAKGRYDSASQRFAEQAYCANEPCVIRLAHHHNQAALIAADILNTKGYAAFINWCEGSAQHRGVKATRDLVLGTLLGINEKGRKALEDADRHFKIVAVQ